MRTPLLKALCILVISCASASLSSCGQSPLARQNDSLSTVKMDVTPLDPCKWQPANASLVFALPSVEKHFDPPYGTDNCDKAIVEFTQLPLLGSNITIKGGYRVVYYVYARYLGGWDWDLIAVFPQLSMHDGGPGSIGSILNPNEIALSGQMMSARVVAKALQDGELAPVTITIEGHKFL